jgi:hypothetical protein
MLARKALAGIRHGGGVPEQDDLELPTGLAVGGLTEGVDHPRDWGVSQFYGAGTPYERRKPTTKASTPARSRGEVLAQNRPRLADRAKAHGARECALARESVDGTLTSVGDANEIPRAARMPSVP